jgi:hypothetical protein
LTSSTASRKPTMTRDFTLATACRRGDFDAGFSGSNPIQPGISDTPWLPGGDRPSADGHVELLSSAARVPHRTMRSDVGPVRSSSRCSVRGRSRVTVRPRSSDRGGRSPTAEGRRSSRRSITRRRWRCHGFVMARRG